MIHARRKINFDWLDRTGKTSESMECADIISEPYPQSFDFYNVSFSRINLSFGMSIVQITHTRHDDNAPESIDIAEVKNDFGADVFMVQSVDRGHILQHEIIPAADVVYMPGQDLFRFSDKVHTVPHVYCNDSCVMTALTITHDTLCTLLGDDTANSLLQSLGLLPAPKVAALPMPPSVSRHLHRLIPDTLTGPLLRLVCHSRAVEYLSALLSHQQCGGDPARTASTGRKRALKIYEMLTEMSGKLPTLDDLAAEFGVSPRTLTNEFKAEYGQPIHSFITELRLNEAHAAIEASAIPLKSLAQRLGYTHTHHFLTAFRRKFGYSPGALRKK